jgi:hypothetical protein
MSELPNAHLLLPSLTGFHRCCGSSCICSGRSKTSSVQSKYEQAATPSCVSGSRRRSRRDCLLCIDYAQTRNAATWTTHTTHHMDLPTSSIASTPRLNELDCHAARPARSSPRLRDQCTSRNQVVSLTLESSNRPDTEYCWSLLLQQRDLRLSCA